MGISRTFCEPTKLSIFAAVRLGDSETDPHRRFGARCFLFVNGWHHSRRPDKEPQCICSEEFTSRSTLMEALLVTVHAESSVTDTLSVFLTLPHG